MSPHRGKVQAGWKETFREIFGSAAPALVSGPEGPPNSRDVFASASDRRGCLIQLLFSWYDGTRNSSREILPAWHFFPKWHSAVLNGLQMKMSSLAPPQHRPVVE